jgi:hypothetical protein
MMMQVMQTDPRFMEVFQVLTGIDLGKMQEEGMKDSKGNEDKMKF